MARMHFTMVTQIDEKTYFEVYRYTRQTQNTLNHETVSKYVDALLQDSHPMTFAA
jgi:hypothetical protein